MIDQALEIASPLSDSSGEELEDQLGQNHTCSKECFDIHEPPYIMHGMVINSKPTTQLLTQS